MPNTQHLMHNIQCITPYIQCLKILKFVMLGEFIDIMFMNLKELDVKVDEVWQSLKHEGIGRKNLWWKLK